MLGSSSINSTRPGAPGGVAVKDSPDMTNYGPVQRGPGGTAKDRYRIVTHCRLANFVAKKEMREHDS